MMKPGWAQKSFKAAKSEVQKLPAPLQQQIENQKNKHVIREPLASETQTASPAKTKKQAS